MKESSLFTFHKDQPIRKFMLKLTTPFVKTKTKSPKDIVLFQLQNMGIDSEISEEPEEDKQMTAKNSFENEILCPLEFSYNLSVSL